MHKKFHYRGVSERSVVELEDEFTVFAVFTVPMVKAKIENFLFK